MLEVFTYFFKKILEKFTSVGVLMLFVVSLFLTLKKNGITNGIYVLIQVEIWVIQCDQETQGAC